jgi:hypothetical protein
MSYKLYVDKNENFECEVSVKNASLKGSIARLIVESVNGPNLIFNGQLNGDKCIIPIKRLKGILDENTHGNMHLEIIVEDTYFKPWQSDFVVEEHTSVKVKVNEQTQSSKPVVRIKTNPILNYVEGKSSDLLPPAKRKGINVFVPKKEIAMICEYFGIRKHNLHRKRKEFIQILKEYFKANPEYNYHSRTILNKIDDFLR